jgi:hypothetical protein
MSFKKEKRCPECHGTEYWHRREINIEFGYGVGDNYPRICGYFYPVSDSSQVIPNSSPRLETWFFDWKSSE